MGIRFLVSHRGRETGGEMKEEKCEEEDTTNYRHVGAAFKGARGCVLRGVSSRPVDEDSRFPPSPLDVRWPFNLEIFPSTQSCRPSCATGTREFLFSTQVNRNVFIRHRFQGGVIE